MLNVCYSLQIDSSSRSVNLFSVYADMFESFLLQILEDRVVFILLSNISHHISLAKKLLFSEQFNHPFLKVLLFNC